MMKSDADGVSVIAKIGPSDDADLIGTIAGLLAVAMRGIVTAAIHEHYGGVRIEDAPKGKPN